MDTTTPALNDLRVYYIPQVPMKAYTVAVPDLATGKLVLDAIVGLSIFEFENNIKPDYSDAAGIERYEDDSEYGQKWYEVDEEEYEPQD